MKKIFFTLNMLMFCTINLMSDCPVPAQSTSTVTLKRSVLGMLKGEFSVASNTKIHFSKGNLQYQASSGLWRFADNQYDVIGGNLGNTATSNRDIQNDWIDLFGWGTSGNSASGTEYQPWTASTTDAQYASSTTGSGMWDSSKSDWGEVNSGFIGDGWRTLTQAEWNHLLTGRTNAANLRTLATVNGCYGLILLPDGWTQAKCGMNKTLSITTSSFSSNNIDLSNWRALELSGAVFLPVAGYRSGTSMNSYSGSNRKAYYWSSTAYSNQHAYVCTINYNSAPIATQQIGRSYGCNVRLVHE